METVIIGAGGKMGSAIESRFTNADDHVTGIYHGDSLDPVENAGLTIVAVKPRSFEDDEDNSKETLAKQWTAEDIHVNEHGLVLSVMAGVTVRRLREVFGTNRVIRTMPTLALRNGKSLTAWYVEDGVFNESEITSIETLLGRWGGVMRLENEGQFHFVTGGVASALEYHFELADHDAAALREAGFSKAQSDYMARWALIGAGSLAESEQETLGKLADDITSPNGTTRKARDVFDKSGFQRMVIKAVRAAARRSEELGGEQHQRKYFWQR